MKLAVTGVGIVSPLGSNLTENMDNLLAMKVGSSPNNVPCDNLSSELIKSTKMFYADYTEEQAREHISAKDYRFADPTVRTSMMAVSEAIRQSGEDLPKDTPVVIGTIQGGITSYCGWVDKLSRKASTKVHPKVLLSSSNEHLGNIISEKYQIHGPTMSVAATCISGVQALSIGKMFLSTGIDRCIVGATDHMTASLSMYYFEQLGALSPTSEVRPWDASRNGTVMGEGSVYLVIEPLKKARARGADIRWVIDGIGIASDAGHPTSPDPDGIGGKTAIKMASNQAGIKTYPVVNGHGTGTPIGDPIEYDVLASQLEQAYLYSNKGQIGHMMGASCLAELALGAESMVRGVVPGNGGLEQPFTEDGRLVFTQGPLKLKYDRFLKTSFGFGGRCSAVSVCKA